MHANDSRLSNMENRKSSPVIGSQTSNYRLVGGSRKSRKLDSPIHRNTMDRSSMLLVEANEISQYLHLDYVFTRGDAGLSNDEVKVLDTKQNISCTWSIIKLKEKLVKIRKLMYAEDSENSRKSIATTELFDPDDSLIHESTEREGVAQHTSDINGSSVKGSMTNAESSHDSVVPTGSSDATDAAGIEIRSNNNNPAGSPSTPRRLSPFLSFPDPDDRSKDQRRFPDMHLPIRSLSCHELRSADKLDGLPEKYLTGSLDEELKKTKLRSAMSFGTNRAFPRPILAPRIKDPVHADRNISFRPSSLRAYTSQQRPASIQPCDAEVQTEGTSMVVREMSTFGLCKDLMTMALTRFSSTLPPLTLWKPDPDLPRTDLWTTPLIWRNTYCSMEVSTVDRILCACESIQQGVQRLWVLRSSSNASNIDERPHLSQNMIESNEVEKVSVQVTISLEVLISHVLTWCALTCASNESIVGELQHSLLHTLKELTKDVVTLWQSCEKEINELVNDSVSRILNLLHQLCVDCGKIAATLDICPRTLSDQKKATLEQVISQKAARLDDLLSVQPSSEVKCSFLAGCDIVVDRSLQQCLQSTDDIHSQIKSFAESCQNDCAESNGELFELACSVITASRTVFVQLQQVQIELYSKTTEDAGADKLTDYYQYYFDRCISMVSESQKLVDCLELVKLAVQPLQTAKIDGGILRKISRCTEMAQRSADRLLRCSCSLRKSQVNSNGNSNFSSASQLLSPAHETHLDEAQAVLVHSTKALCGSIKDKLARDFADEAPPTAEKVRRLLPATPSRIHIMRCQSASICDQRTILSKQLSLCSFSPRGTELRNAHWNK